MYSILQFTNYNLRRFFTCFHQARAIRIEGVLHTARTDQRLIGSRPKQSILSERTKVQTGSAVFVANSLKHKALSHMT